MPTKVSRHRSPSFRAAAGVVGLLALLLVLAAVTIVGGASGVGCVGCHAAMREASESDPAAHTDADCAACHAADLADRVGLGAHTLGELLPFTSAGDVTDVTNEACLSCHSEVLDTTVRSSTLSMQHATCVDRSCRECHAASLHASPVLENRMPTMDVCLSCHATITRPEGCELCHVSGGSRSGGTTPWRVTHGVRWETTHGAGDLTTCRFCHTGPDECTECHIDMPHPGDWAGTHGIGVSAQRETCVACHQSAFCDSCHGIEMPHPEGWLPGHSASTNGYDDPICTRCHLTEDCTACHVAHTHPGKATPDD